MGSDNCYDVVLLSADLVIVMATVEGEYFGQMPPPLSVTIKGILEKYPDGQIFKFWIFTCRGQLANESSW